jgi:hypothetical protein
MSLCKNAQAGVWEKDWEELTKIVQVEFGRPRRSEEVRRYRRMFQDSQCFIKASLQCAFVSDMYVRP